MDRRRLCTGLLILGLLALPGFSGPTRAAQEVEARGLVFQEGQVTFSHVYPGERVEYVFRFTNRGPESVQILEVKPT